MWQCEDCGSYNIKTDNPGLINETCLDCGSDWCVMVSSKHPAVKPEVCNVAVITLKKDNLKMENTKSHLPDDYKECVLCGYDHIYDAGPAKRWHDNHNNNEEAYSVAVSK